MSALELTIADLNTQGEKREQALAELHKKLQNIEERVELKKLMPKIKEYAVMTFYLSQFQGIKRSLTEVAKKANEVVINRGFEQQFEKECEALTAPKVNLEFFGRGGKTIRRRTLTTRDHNLTEILSEGEQKAIALADFLAEEVSLKSNTSPIVFDDPVTSLDYKRLSNVVERLVDLSQNRQVIVFTHDIWFASDLCGRFEEESVGSKEYLLNKIKSKEKCTGLVTQDSKLEDTFKTYKKEITDTLGKASKEADKKIHFTLVKDGYVQLRKACEAIAIQDILQNVVSPYRPNVMMKSLKNINADRLPDAIRIIIHIFNKCSRFVHTPPLPTIEEQLTLNELREDWENLKKARDAYLKKKNTP